MKTRLIARACLQEVSAQEAAQIEIPKRAIASELAELEDQRDLLRMSSILVSTGMNLNDDVFIPEEILLARDTGAHKPVNIEHDETRIIGHMLRTFVTAKDGTRLEDDDIEQALSSDDETWPTEFDITNEAVIYAFVLPEIAKDIKQKAVAGELFVSVEAWFTDFDFLVGNQVVARNRDTAPILDPILRSNGGKGRFQGQKVGRVLRNILFGGIGVVAEPANPESVGLSVGSGCVVELNECNVESIDEVLAQHVVGSLNSSTSTQKEEKDMSGDSKDLSRNDVLEEVAAIMKAKEADNSAVDDNQDNQETQVEPASEASDKKFEELREENQALSERIRRFEVQELKRDRSEALVEAGLSAKQAQARITKCIAMDDETFTAYLEDVKELVVASETLTEEEGGSEETEAKSEAKAEEVVEETEEVETKAEASVEDDEDISLDLGDITQVDNDVPVKSNSSAKIGTGDLVERFADAFAPVLKSRNSKLFGDISKTD
ncbi:hypothetical protein KAR91_50090 [Candidatus Pacearchaeota archaeon]|nr:hypothetical protein [Candidatus Pacearchaeota archaeon]